MLEKNTADVNRKVLPVLRVSQHEGYHGEFNHVPLFVVAFLVTFGLKFISQFVPAL